MQYSLLPYSVFCPHCACFPLILSLWWCCRQFEITEEPHGRSAGEFVQEFCAWGSLRCILFSPPGACRVIPSEVCVKGPLLLCSAVSCAASITADSRPCQDCVTRRDASCHILALSSSLREEEQRWQRSGWFWISLGPYLHTRAQREAEARVACEAFVRAQGTCANAPRV